MRTSIRLTVLLLAGLVTGLGPACITSQSLQVKTQHDPEADFKALQVFRIVSETPEDTSLRRLLRITREVVDSELVERGLVQADDQPADVWVEIELILRGKRQAPPGEEVRRSQAEAEPATAAGYSRSGTLVIKMLRPRTREVLWHGVLTGITPDPLLAREELRQAAWRLLAEYPPLATP